MILYHLVFFLLRLDVVLRLDETSRNFFNCIRSNKKSGGVAAILGWLYVCAGMTENMYKCNCKFEGT